MSQVQNIAEFEEINISHKFFEDVKNSNIKELRRVFLDENIRPWEFLEDDGYTGKNLLKKLFIKQLLWTCQDLLKK